MRDPGTDLTPPRESSDRSSKVRFSGCARTQTFSRGTKPVGAWASEEEVRVRARARVRVRVRVPVGAWSLGDLK